MSRKEGIMKGMRGNVKNIFLSLALVMLAAFAFGFSAKAAGRLSAVITTNDEVGPGKTVNFHLVLTNNADKTYAANQLKVTVFSEKQEDTETHMTITTSDFEVNSEGNAALNKSGVDQGHSVKADLKVNLTSTWNDGSSLCVVVTDESTDKVLDMALYTKLPYQDIKPGEWFYNSAALMNRMGIMTGMDNMTFSPNVKLSRAQYATILWRWAGSPDVAYDAAKFPDVPDNQFYTKAVMWANSKGVITGYGSGSFGPADLITREDLALMVYRYENITNAISNPPGDLSSYPDAGKITPVSLDAMKWAVNFGLISGNGDGTLEPQGTADRAQCAAIMSRYYMSGKYPVTAERQAGTAQIMMEQ